MLIGAISSKTTKPTIKTIKESIPHSENMKRYLKIMLNRLPARLHVGAAHCGRENFAGLHVSLAGLMY